MKSPLTSIGLAALLLGFALGRISAPAGPDRGHSVAGNSARGESVHSGADDGSPGLPGIERPQARTRVARERTEEAKPKEPRVSLPLSTVVKILKDGNLKYAEFDSLPYRLGEALTLLGATEAEKEQVKSLADTSKAGILAMEKSHLRLAETSEHMIRFDMSGMREPVEEITGRLKDDIRMSLPADMAEGLVSAINWEKFYVTEDESATRLEITRNRKGRLTAWEKSAGGGTGRTVDSQYADDGTPLPADKIFEDRWKPLLKGVTILPKDEE